MGNRLSKIYTKTGDKGTTGLSNGTRVSKDDIRISAIGSIDELNSIIGIVLSFTLDEETRKLLTKVQHKLFNIGGELSLPGYALIEESHVHWLEHRLDELNSNLPPLKEFILPGGSTAASYCHLARSVCRRAERNLVSLEKEDNVSDAIMQYVNRLSDFLFVLARDINRQEGQSDIFWNATDKD